MNKLNPSFKYFSLAKMLVLISLLALTACGGGGGGSSDPDPVTPTISGDTSGVDDGSGNISGDLNVSGGDSFIAVNNTPTDYGTFSINTTGSWNYAVDSSNSNFIELGDGDTASEGITASTSSGLSQTITVTVEGVNDAPIIGTGDGVDSGTIEVSSPTAISGALSIVDPDLGESAFIAQSGTVGTYGSFSITASGDWTYTLNTATPSPLAQTASDNTVSATASTDDNETFPVISADGTSHNVVILVTGIVTEPDTPAEVVIPSTPTEVEEVVIDSASDDGTHNTDQGPANAIDGNTDSDSRWSSEGSGKELLLDLGSAQTAGALQILWFKGDERQSYFNISVLADMDDATQEWITVFDSQQSSSGSSNSYEIVNFPHLYSASKVKLIGYGNSDDNSLWNSVVEIEVYNKNLTEVVEPEPPKDPTEGTSPGDIVETPEGTPSDILTYDVNPNSYPSENFDLSYWYLSVPTDTNSSGTSDSISITELNNDYEDSRFFYTGSDGGLVFKCPIYGYKTSTNTSYTRVELRELVGKTDDGKSDLSNNWVFSSAPLSMQNAAGAVDGVMKATLAVNHVTETIEYYTEDGKEKDSEYRVGRLVIGQIHAEDDEPIRVYYQKLPSHDKGSIYFAHDPVYGSEVWVDMIGEKGLDDDDAEPTDGIELDEIFSYEVNVQGNVLTFSVMREGKATVTKSISMNGSYDLDSDYMYFKAGLYMADKLAYDYDDYSDDPNDDLLDTRADEYGQVTFYALEVMHN